MLGTSPCVQFRWRWLGAPQMLGVVLTGVDIVWIGNVEAFDYMSEDVDGIFLAGIRLPPGDFGGWRLGPCLRSARVGLCSGLGV